MAGRLVIPCLKNSNRVSTRLYSVITNPPPNFKYGDREIVGPGHNGQPEYLDLEDYPFPAIRFKPITPDLQFLKEKEKGDWRKLTIDEKKTLYRASFYLTFAEYNAPTGEWKSIIGSSLMLLSIGFVMFTFMKVYMTPPLPASFTEEALRAQLRRMRLLDVNPINGLNRRE